MEGGGSSCSDLDGRRPWLPPRARRGRRARRARGRPSHPGPRCPHQARTSQPRPRPRASRPRPRQPFALANGPLDLSIEHSTTVADGVVLHEIVQRRGGPNVIHVLEIDPQAKVTLDLTGAGNAYPALAPTSKMGEQHHALAAINGEFFELPGARSSCSSRTARCGRPRCTSRTCSPSPRTNGASTSTASIPRSAPRTSPPTRPVRVTDWNTVDPKGSHIVGYTPIGGKRRRAAGERLHVAAERELHPSRGRRGQKGVEQTFTAGRRALRGVAPALQRTGLDHPGLHPGRRGRAGTAGAGSRPPDPCVVDVRTAGRARRRRRSAGAREGRKERAAAEVQDGVLRPATPDRGRVHLGRPGADGDR